jgi:ribosomal protein L28
MSPFCAACGRGALTVNLRSKSEVAVKSRQKINLQSRRINGKRVNICVRCLKTMARKPHAVKIETRHTRLPKRRTKQSA